MPATGSLEHALTRRKPAVLSILNGAEKAAWASEPHRFSITAVKLEDTPQFGLQWMYVLDDGAVCRTLALGSNVGRDADAQAMIEEIEEFGPIGPCVLFAVPLRGKNIGKSMWTFQAAPTLVGDLLDDIPFE